MSREKELGAIRTIEKDLRDLRNDLDSRLVELRKQVDDLQKRAEKTVTERPLLALGVAFAVGMAFGIALSRRND